MSGTISERRLRVTSEKFSNHPSRIYSAFLHMLGWSVAIAYTIAVAAFAINRVWPAVVLAALVGPFIVYKFPFNSRAIKASDEQYTVELDARGAKLYTFDAFTKKKIVEWMNWEHVRSAELHEANSACQTEALILKSSAQEIEIPLWAFPERSQESIINFVRVQGHKPKAKSAAFNNSNNVFNLTRAA